MSELGGTVEYLYWSDRRTSRFMEDNGLSISSATRTISSPSLKFFPTITQSKTSTTPLRPQIAKLIEDSPGQIAVTRFDAPGPIRYAKGKGCIVFGEFMSTGVSQPSPPAVMF